MSSQHEKHEPGTFYWSADSDFCKHGAEPDSETDGEAWDAWSDQHPFSDDDRICLGAPAGEACLDCSAQHGDMVPWSRCEGRDHIRPKQGIVPNPDAEHQQVPVWVGGIDCLERECDEYYNEDGDEKPGMECCSHIREETACSCQRDADGFYDTKPCTASAGAETAA
jgi:hypothetical protein